MQSEDDRFKDLFVSFEPLVFWRLYWGCHWCLLLQIRALAWPAVLVGMVAQSARYTDIWSHLHCKSPSFITQSQLEHGNGLIFGGICTVSACRIHGVLSRCWLLQASSIFVETFSYVHFLGTVLQVLHGPQQPLRCATSSLSGGADIRNLKIFSHCLDSMNQSTFLFLGIPSPSRAPHCCGGLHKPSTQLRCISSLSAVWVMSPQI